MTSRVVMGLRAVQVVAARRDPTAPMAVGAIARELASPLSSVSRLCAELEELALLERGESYGAYRLGTEGVRLSGAAAAPFARAVRFALTRAGQETGETVCLAAAGVDGIRVIAAVESPWTLHAPAEVGELVAEQSSAIAQAASGRHGQASASGEALCVEATRGKQVEVATAVLDPSSGQCIGVLAVRMPVYRAKLGAPRARRALTAARRSLERAIADGPRAPRETQPADSAPPRSGLGAALCILRHLAAGPDSLAGVARASGLRPDRTARLIDSCRRSGMVQVDAEGGTAQIAWSVHGWYRAAAIPTLVEGGTPLVAELAAASGACAFLTVLKGMRSFTLVEELAVLGEGLRMAEWKGRPHPIVGSDGGPTLVMDLDPEQLTQIFPARHTPQEVGQFLERVRKVALDGVLSMESIDEFGITSISAPVRDASGIVAAAACVVGATEYIKPQLGEIERATRLLAEQVSALLQHAVHEPALA
jgi:DNA-binding IclR family transcriptional regulator